MRVLPVIFVWLLWFSVCSAYRFLGVFPVYTKSHFNVLEGVAKGLISKGHQIDVISPFPQKEPYPNYTDIVALKPSLKMVNSVMYDSLMTYLTKSDIVHIIAKLFGNDVCADHLGNPLIQKLVRHPPKDPPYDAMIMEIYGAHCFAAIADLLNIPLIGVSTTSMYPWLNDHIAQPENLAFLSNNLVGYESPLNFWQRTYNVLHTVYCKLSFNYITKPQDDLVRKYFGPNLPSIRNMNLALVLINSHIALNGIQPMTPAVVPIGGIHIRDDDLPLPPDLKKWMDDSKDGFIYFTFGSMVLIETFPRKILDIFYSSLKKIAPVRVVIKIPNPKKLPPGLPENIYTQAWMPQQEVLKHPNIRAFITHGGLLSTMEAVTCGVPMIGIPLFADQSKNFGECVKRVIGIQLDVHKFTQMDLDAALNAILYNSQYMENVKNLSKKFLDQPLSPVDTANYWIEYVIKYGGDSLRSPAMDLAWWQLYLIDVVACSLFSAIVIIIAVIAVAALIIHFLIEVKNAYHHKMLYSKKVN